MSYGMAYLRGKAPPVSLGFDRPVTMLNALPLRTAELISDWPRAAPVVSVLRTFAVARLPTILASLLLAYLLAIWSFELFGESAMRATLLLYILSPNILAHAVLVTSDLYGCLGITAALYFCFRFLRQPGWKTAIIGGFVLALAQMTKFLAFYAFLFTALLVAARIRKLPQGWKLFLAYHLVAVASTLVLIHLVFATSGFGPLSRLSNMTFESKGFQTLQSVPILSQTPLPLPKPFIAGLDKLMITDLNAWNYGGIYLFGELREPGTPGFRPFRFYYLAVYLFKQPLALQVLLLLGLVHIFRRSNAADFLRREACIIVPMAGYFVIASVFQHAQIGIRHVLPSLVLAALIAGSWFENWQTAARPKKIAGWALLGYLAVSMFSYFPHMIPYTNELVVDKKQTFRLFADSNLSWGQNYGMVKDFLSKNPDVAFNPTSFRTGRILVDTNNLVGVMPGDCRWLLSYQPIGHVGYAHLLFDIPAR
jgi:4-amino-4-deoxy-L-arabinose transferase-like glycosyltransferase